MRTKASIETEMAPPATPTPHPPAALTLTEAAVSRAAHRKSKPHRKGSQSEPHSKEAQSKMHTHQRAHSTPSSCQAVWTCALLSALPTGYHWPDYICVSLLSIFLPSTILSFLQTPLLSKLITPSLTGHLYLSSPVPCEYPTIWDFFPQVLGSALGILVHRAPLAYQEHPMKSYSTCSEVRPSRDIHQKVWGGN